MDEIFRMRDPSADINSRMRVARGLTAELARARIERSAERFIRSLCNCAFSHDSVVPTLMTRRIFPAQVSVEEDLPEKSNHPETMVGQASEDVEAGRVDGGVSTSYVHEGGPSSSWRTAITCDKANEATTRAGVATSSSLTIKTEIKTEIEQESELTHDSESTLYGTYDEATKSVTIIYPGEENGDVGIQECVQEITTDDAKYLRPPSRCSQYSPAYTMSPGSHHSDLDAEYCGSGVQQDCASLSDGGYESHDSPHTRPPVLNDLWHESFTELFPALA